MRAHLVGDDGVVVDGLAGAEHVGLGPGESIYYDSIVPHQVRAHNGQNAKFLACVYTPF